MAEPDSPRITRMRVEGLFGRYNHDIALRPERVTILHGPNGVGKTALLRMIHWALAGDPASMLEYP